VDQASYQTDHKDHKEMEMKEYHKIQSVFKRDPANNHKTFLIGDYSVPVFGYLENTEWIWTEKVDGTNIRVFFNEGKVTFGGRTDRAQIPATLFERLQELFTPQAGSLDGPICLYGEGYGPKIQKGGGNYSAHQDFVLFDVRAGDIWLERENVQDIATKLGIDVVPIVGRGTLRQMVMSCEDGITSTWGDFEAEGYVARPAVELKTRTGERIITKVKCRDFREVPSNEK
jgi:hypothetical protein